MSLPSIHTPRILLRPWTLDDIDALHALWTAPEVRRWLWDDVLISRETVEQVVETHLMTSDQHGIGFWAQKISPPQEPVTGKMIDGFCGFRFIDDGPEIELMYGLRGEHWGKGLATEACAAALEYLWRTTEFQQVYAHTDAPNQQSVRVMERLNMSLDSARHSMVAYLLRRPTNDE